MQLDTLTIVTVILAAIAAGAVVWIPLRRNLPPEASQVIAEAVAKIKDLLGEVVTEAEVRAMAAWAYDKLGAGSQYYSREQFIDLVTRAVMRALDDRVFIANLAARDSALAAEMKRAARVPA